MKLSDFFTNSSLVTLKIKVWSATERSRDADHGITDGATVEKGMSLPIFKLADKDALSDIRAIRTLARETLAARANVFPWIKGAHWMRDEDVAPLFTEFTRLRARFTAAIDALVTQLDKVKTAALATARASMEAVPGHDLATIDGAIKRLSAGYPDEASIRSKFKMTWNVFTIQGKDSIPNLEGELEEVKDILQELIARPRQDLIDRIDEVTAITKKAGKLPARSVDTTKKLLEKLRKLNIAGDSALARAIEGIEQLVDAADVMTEQSIVDTFAAVKASLQEGYEEAVAEAEANLTQMGDREVKRPKLLNVAPPEEAPAREVKPVDMTTVTLLADDEQFSAVSE